LFAFILQDNRGDYFFLPIYSALFYEEICAQQAVTGSSASSDSGDAREDGFSIPICPQLRILLHARMQWLDPTTIVKKNNVNGRPCITA